MSHDLSPTMAAMLAAHIARSQPVKARERVTLVALVSDRLLSFDPFASPASSTITAQGRQAALSWFAANPDQLLQPEQPS